LLQRFAITDEVAVPATQATKYFERRTDGVGLLAEKERMTS